MKDISGIRTEILGEYSRNIRQQIKLKGLDKRGNILSGLIQNLLDTAGNYEGSRILFSKMQNRAESQFALRTNSGKD